MVGGKKGGEMKTIRHPGPCTAQELSSVSGEDQTQM